MNYYTTFIQYNKYSLSYNKLLNLKNYFKEKILIPFILEFEKNHEELPKIFIDEQNPLASFILLFACLDLNNDIVLGQIP